MGETISKLQCIIASLFKGAETFGEIGMPLSSKDVENIAHLARLRFADDEIPGFTENLSRIIDFVNQLDAAPTGDTLPMAHPLDEPQRLREDIVSESDQRASFQENAPATEAGLYLVPKVIE